jgi:GT2 family glycosyltransferase/glycosyltransferase involved in cell wall biosynthesis
MHKETQDAQCDIIIPIYNAYDCLEECIDSVINNTDLVNNNLILIDDASTDERVWDLLKTYKKKYPEFKVIQNEKNLGFVGTTNKVMKLLKNDVLLLNSDTIVTPRWLEKIKECAYSQEMVATGTPLSNNATLSSVPNIFEENELPNGISLEEMNDIVEKCSYNDYPEIPTAHGFCMYIKRSVLEEVGYFDEKSFGKGYGEENDFCFRCFDYGYRHLLCDNTYIYHKESQSFSNTKFQLRKSAVKVLDKRYPKYQERLRDWCANRPIKYIGQNIAFELGKNQQKGNILFLIHDWKDVKTNLGGTTLHAYDLIKELRHKYNFHVLAPEDNVYKLYSYWTDSESEIKFAKSINFKEYGFYNEDYAKRLDQIVSDYSIDIVHIHHMIGHYFDIVNVIKKHNLYSLLSLHDLYSVCPVINKMYKREVYCGNPSVEKCGECLKFCTGMRNNMIEVWHQIWGNLFNSVNDVICPSDAAKNEILMTYKNSELSVIEHGVNIKKEKSELLLEDNEVVNIAFIGVIVKHKGSEIFEYLIKRARLKNVKIHLFGVTDLPVKEYKYFINHGVYKRSSLCKKLKKNNIKLICLFSMTPESYSYTLTESIACGIPVLGVDIGAIGDRVKRDNLGWLIDLDSKEGDYAKKIKEILSNKEEYEEKIRSINNYKIRTTEVMASDYEKLYSDSVIKDCNYNEEDIKSLIKKSDTYFSNITSMYYPNYSWVFDTLKWRIISRFKIPMSIKRIYYKIRNR